MRYFRHCQNTHYVLNITFIFGRCGVVTPAKYKCDSKNLTDTFARSNILLTEKLTNGALVTSTLEWPGSVDFRNFVQSSIAKKVCAYDMM